MTTSVDSDSAAPTVPGDSVPWVDAVVVSEFAFCPRAGIIAHEQRLVPKELPQRPNLNYLPQYSLVELERALAQLITQIMWRCIGVITTVVFALVVEVFSSARWILIPAGLFIVLQGIGLGRPFRQITLLRCRHRQALAAEPIAPEPNSPTRQSVNWWNLLRVGFMSVPYREELRDEVLRLCGLPWRVLRQGSLRIPVYKYFAPPHGPVPASTDLQQTVLASAFCHLLTTCEAMESPYGIVLLGDTYVGLTLPQSDAARAALCATVAEAQTHIAALPRHLPDRPTTDSACRTCRHGRPRMYHQNMLPQTLGGCLLRVHGEPGRDGRLYHSLCGDRFRWTPPHEEACELGLPVSRPKTI